jgi:REP element-mobilizing transposase RayT
MSSGLHRTYGAHHLHFITNSCYQRRPLLGSAQARDRFLTVLEQTRQRYHFVVVGYVVMPEHVHLLITESEVGSPSTVMQVLNNARPGPCCQREGAVIRDSATCFTRKGSGRSGCRASTTSTYGARKSESRSCGTCIAIPWSGDWLILQSNGAGAAIGTIFSMKLVP